MPVIFLLQIFLLEKFINTKNKLLDLKFFKIEYENFKCLKIHSFLLLSVEVGVSSTTIGYWLSILEASRIIFKLHTWYASHSSQVVKTPKVYFCDTGLF